jgi:hypothetical protein
MKLKVVAQLKRKAVEDNEDTFDRSYDIATGSFESDDDEGIPVSSEIVIHFDCDAILDGGVWYCNIEGGYHSDYDFTSFIEDCKKEFEGDLKTVHPGAVVQW